MDFNFMPPIAANLTFWNRCGRQGYARVKERYKEFSPAHNVNKDDPPAIVFLGTEDKLIPVKTVEEFQKKMQAVGLRCDIRLYEGQGHGFSTMAKATLTTSG